VACGGANVERAWKACGGAPQTAGRLAAAGGIETGMPAALLAAPQPLGHMATNPASFPRPPACRFDRDKILSEHLGPHPEKRVNPHLINPIP
jgi:hypothetical protein